MICENIDETGLLSLVSALWDTCLILLSGEIVVPQDVIFFFPCDLLMSGSHYYDWCLCLNPPESRPRLLLVTK